MSRYRFTLFVAGDTARSQRAYASLQRICRERLGEEFTIELVDVVSAPEKAEEHRVLTTPTVVKEHPEPRRRIILGPFQDVSGVLSGHTTFLAGEAPADEGEDPREE
ncbi:MAG: circadian clock KaiB family protein [Longimicrobiaceae bacterium]